MLAGKLDDDDVDDDNNDYNSKIHAVLWQTNLRTGGGDLWYHSGSAPDGTKKITMIAITGIQH